VDESAPMGGKGSFRPEKKEEEKRGKDVPASGKEEDLYPTEGGKTHEYDFSGKKKEKKKNPVPKPTKGWAIV